jgi:PAS domain S-box-containing protein
MTHEPPGAQPPAPKQVDELLASPELMKAVEGNDDFKRVLDHIPIAIAVSQSRGGGQRIVYANGTFEALTGLAFGDIEGQDWSVLPPFRHEDRTELTLTEAVLRGEDYLGTFRYQRADAPVLTQAYVSRIEGEDGSEIYRIVALVDVLEREQAQRDEFELRIRDQDLLLKELQYRVKNNLQLITALVRLEARNAQRGSPVDFDALAGRIESLALLYQALSAETFDNQIDLGAYLSGIASNAVRTFALPNVRLDLKVGYCPVSVNVAMPVGLLLNELLANAFRYAFDGQADGTVSVECGRAGDSHVQILVADDGVGFPAGETWPRRGRLGALILQTLRENTSFADFKLESAPGRGTRVKIEFVHAAPKTN